jgi:hypothetical protein
MTDEREEQKTCARCIYLEECEDLREGDPDYQIACQDYEE